MTIRLAVDRDTSPLFADRSPALYFRYWCPADPDAVFAALRDGRALPSRDG